MLPLPLRLSERWRAFYKFSGEAKHFSINNPLHIPPKQFLAVITLGLTLFFILCSTRAQDTATAAGDSVQMIVSVEPRHGNQIPMITQQDIMVYQGHDRLPVTGWIPAKGEKAGLQLAILIDESAGFSLGAQLNDIRSFISQQPPSTLIAVGYMQNGTVNLASDFTSEHAATTKSIRLTQGYFGAEGSPYLSLSTFIKGWHSNSPAIRREVLMITSGIDNVYMGNIDNPYVDAAIQDAQCAGVVVYSIYTPSAGHMGHSYYRTYWGENYLSELAEATGGESYYLMGPQAPVSFSPYLKKLNEQLPNQFLLSFQPKTEKKAGLQSVRVTSEIHDVDFLHQDKVCIPAAPKE
ncbi:MAG TPA: hypothetical protein VG272_03445 [Candidatus Acidoferrales bacterium]|nr:hypothetical protein [Candidatus Acidoferrales bacterium]